MTCAKRALISVTDKSDLDLLCPQLIEYGYDIFSSGGTYKHLKQLDIPVTDISSYINFPEIMSGRVKTLHPKIHGGILAKRDDPTHLQQAKEHGILMFNLVVVNLYEFEKYAQNKDLPHADVIEHIDIGGPSMLRSAAKNFQDVCVLSSIKDYKPFLNNIKNNSGYTDCTFRKEMAKQTFARTYQYDQAIFNYLDQNTIPKFQSTLKKTYDLRYGENPHQNAAFFQDTASPESILKQDIPGKQLSYNNLLDMHAALKLISDFSDQTACAIFKHNNPCGIAVSEKGSLMEAYKHALAGDPISAFGGIVVFSKSLDAKTTKEMLNTFTELVIAPNYTEEAKTILKQKKNLRYLQYTQQQLKHIMAQPVTRSVIDGFLIQDQDLEHFDQNKFKCVTEKKPSAQEWKALNLAWTAVKHVKSNAITVCNDTQLLGIGAGQTSRVDSCNIAIHNAQKTIANKNILVAASDAFFPFKDGLETLVNAGIKSVIQPGGSIKDKDIIACANEHRISMVLTGIRHFNH